MSFTSTSRNHHMTCGLRNNRAAQPWALLLAILFAVTSMGLTAGCVASSNGQSSPVAPQQLSLQFSPSNVSFGKVVAGKKTSQTASVTNLSTSNVVIAQVSSSNNAFTISGVSFPLTLGAGQSANFVVWFTGSTAGNASSTLSFQASDSSVAPAQVVVSAVTSTPLPQLALSTTSLDAGSAVVGTRANSSVTVSNTGTADLNISMIAVSGAAYSVSGIATPAIISAGNSSVLNVAFAPTTAGAANGSITISSNDPASPSVISLAGTGTAAPVGHLTLNPAILNFGNTNVGANSVLTSTLTNSGQGVLHISSDFASGTGFTVSGLATPATLNAGQSAQVQVTYAPTATGISGGTVAFTTDAPGAAPGLSVNGTGVQGTLAVTPGSLNFSNVITGAGSTQSVQVSNSGSSSLTITQANLTGTGFSFSGLSLPLTIAAGQSSSFNVQFVGQAAGTVNGNLALVSNAGNAQAGIALSATSIASTQTLQLSSSSINFGNVNSGSSANQTLTVKNAGNSATTVTQVSVVGSYLTISGISTPLTLAPQQTASLTVQYSPTAAGSLSGMITIVNGSGTSSATVIGTATQASLSAIPGSVNFSNVVTGATNSQSVQLSNTGNASLTITQANLTGTGFSITGLTLPLTIAASHTGTFTVQFVGQAAGTVSGSLSLVSNAANSPASLPMSATSISATGTMQVSVKSLNFGSVNAGATATKTVTLTNTGNANVAVSSISINGTNFALSGSGAVTLSAGQTDTFSVLYAPAGSETDNGSVSIVSNAAGSPAAVALSGTGVAQQTSHSVQLSWNDSDSTIVGYNVYRSTISGTGYLLANSGLVGLDTFSDASVQSGMTYYYVTTAVDSSGTESAYSNEAQAIIP